MNREKGMKKSFESLLAFYLLSHNKWLEITFLNFESPVNHSLSRDILLMITILTENAIFTLTPTRALINRVIEFWRLNNI